MKTLVKPSLWQLFQYFYNATLSREFHFPQHFPQSLTTSLSEFVFALNEGPVEKFRKFADPLEE